MGLSSLRQALSNSIDIVTHSWDLETYRISPAPPQKCDEQRYDIAWHDDGYRVCTNTVTGERFALLA